MTIPSSHTKPARTKHFTIQRGTDGCDETFEIVCIATGASIASFGFWDEAAHARRNARKFARALESFYENGGHFYESALAVAIRALSNNFHDWKA